MFGLELAAIYFKVMPGLIDQEMVKVRDVYLDGVNRKPMGVAAQAMAYNPDMFISGEGAGRSREKI